MAREFAEAFYHSRVWKRCRKSYIAYRVTIDGGLCETCHDRLGQIVHHKVWLTPDNINDPDISLNHLLLKYDCLICHNKERENEERRYDFDENGDVVKREL